MDLYLAESGGCLRAYIVPNSGQVRSATPSEDMEVYLAGIEGRQKMLLGQDQEGASNLISTANILQSFG